jgi:hypothetical protein
MATTKTTAQATGTARASGALGLKFLTIQETPEPSGTDATSHSHTVHFAGNAHSLLLPIAEA